jgi:hypothetical protein
MEEVLNFNPEDLEVLDNFDFDETIQRPEAIRFYTLDEQISDAFEKLVPAGKVSTFKLKQLATQTDKIRDLYESFVIPTDDSYLIREASYGKKIDWIFPVYANAVPMKYDYSAEWVPILKSTNSGFYPRMINALPSQYGVPDSGIPYVLTSPTKMVNRSGENPIIGLPGFKTTKRQKHEDGRINIVESTIGKPDQLNFVGYYAKKRELGVNVPLPDHLFLKDNEAVLVESTAPLHEVIPSIGAIMTHVVPSTRDPYSEGMKYLKLYDVSLASIPWSLWKTRFPPVDQAPSPEVPSPIEFPAHEQVTAPPKLLDIYKTTAPPGVSIRKWLMDQEDGGALVAKMLLSSAGEAGNVNIVPGIDLSSPRYPDTDIESCNLSGITFNEFINRGVLRNDADGTKCVPVDLLRQERKRVGYLNRQAWGEETGHNLLKTYLSRLETYRREVRKLKYVPEPKTESVADSERRKQVVAVLVDPERTMDDKYRDIKKLIESLPLVDNIYRDPKVVVCSHTMAILAGEFEKSPQTFNEEWTALENGFRTCKFCGEKLVEQEFLNQDVYDENGFVLRHSESFGETVFHATKNSSFTISFNRLSETFNKKNAGHDMVLLLLSLMQILPSEDRVTPFIALINDLSMRVKPDDSRDKNIGMIGIAATCILIQTHIPMLVPNRSFGPTPLVLNGYPRDEGSSETFNIVDSMFLVIRKTFASIPTAFKGPARDAIKSVLDDADSTRNRVIRLIDSICKRPEVAAALDAAKQFVPTIVAVEQPRAIIPSVRPPAEMGIITGYPSCESGSAYWTTAKPPAHSQLVYVIPQPIGETSAPLLTASVSERVAVKKFDNKKIADNLKLGAPRALTLKIGDDWRANVRLATRLASMFQIQIPELAKIDPTEDNDLLRDISTGFLYKIFHEIYSSPEKRRIFDGHKVSDISLYVMLADVQKERAIANTARARERETFTARMKIKSDLDREITKELLDIGLAPYIITNEDRETFAAELMKNIGGVDEEIVEEDLVDDAGIIAPPDIGVGEPRDPTDDDLDAPNRDAGDYGDARFVPIGRDYDLPNIAADREGSL